MAASGGAVKSKASRSRVVAPRMFGILAAEAAVGLLLRRGPSKWCQAIVWHTDTDQIERGQWVHHRVAERGADLSPDGRLFVYSGVGGGGKYEKWMAVSRLGFFSALVLWSVPGPGTGCGCFTGKRALDISEVGEAKKEWGKVPLQITRNKLWDEMSADFRAETFGKWGFVEWMRMHRDRWKRVSHGEVFWWERAVGYGMLRKRRILRSQAKNWEGALVREEYAFEFDGQHEVLADVDWAEVDQRGRLVFTRLGKLFAAKVTRKEIEEREIADFTGDVPVGVAPPAWALTWPG